MSTFERAVEIAAKAHRGQTHRKGLPYLVHPLTVMTRVRSLEARIVAVLHDVVEDSDVTLDDLRREGFAPEIVEAVDYLTHREGESYEDYVRRAVSHHPLAREVKIADLSHNMEVTQSGELTEKNRQRLEKYRAAQRILEETAQ